MPFTVSHVAAVLPLARTRLPLAALAVGAVVPDLPYYLPMPSLGTHAPWGLPVDVVLGAAVLLVVRTAVREPVAALAPRTVRERIPAAPAPLTRRHAAAAGAALLIGAATHILWDSVTQPGGAGVQLLPALQASVVGPHRVYNVLMYVSSAGGLAALAVWARLRLRATPPAERPVAALRPAARWCAVAAVALASAAGAVALGMSPRAAVSSYDLVRCVLVGAMQGAGAGLAGHVAVWHLVRAARRIGGSGGVGEPGARGDRRSTEKTSRRVADSSR
ncbi:DUF4184 family protein [Nocardiopsis sediminis]|uniref:DUF4184 family protein n=1 Tax=Nocardiopsis sediminis TaxID=1778267 RepID=A0ABV8FVZ2_9ACTN